MKWNEREIQKIKKKYQEKTDEDLAEELGKTKHQVRRKRQNLGLKKSGAEWTDDELKKIEREYQEKTDEEIAEELGKTKHQVRRKRQNLGLKKSGGQTSNNWSEEETKWLEENFDQMSDKDLSSELDKPEHEIQRKRYELKLKKDPQKGGIYSQESAVESVERSGEKIHIKQSIGTGRKNHLQGRLGELLTDSLKNQAENYLKLSLDDHWDFFGWNMDVLNRNYEIRGNLVDQKTDREIVPRTNPPQIFSAETENEIRNLARSQYVLADKDLLAQYAKVHPPSVDKKYYAVEYADITKEIKFEIHDSTIPLGQEGDHIHIELPVISDFRILAVEVKTTSSDVRDSLTEAQADALKSAEQSEYLQFYTMKVDPEEFSIPDSVRVELMKMD